MPPNEQLDRRAVARAAMMSETQRARQTAGTAIQTTRKREAVLAMEGETRRKRRMEKEDREREISAETERQKQTEQNCTRGF